MYHGTVSYSHEMAAAYTVHVYGFSYYYFHWMCASCTLLQYVSKVSVLHVNPNCPVLIVLPISTGHIWTPSCHYASTVEVDVKCMQANFGGRSLLGCRDFAPFSFAFKMDEISLQTMDNSPWGLKNRISSKNSCK